MSLGIFIVVAFVWAASGTAYWLYRSTAPRRYSAYAAGRLDTVFAIFGLSTYALAVAGGVLLVVHNV